MSKNSLQPSKAQHKTNKKDCLKNVLASPFSRNWPLLSEEHASQLIDLLQSVKGNSQQTAQHKDCDGKNSITYGLNACIQQTKSSTIDIMIISAEIKPRYIVNEIILLILARNQQATILCVPNLSQKLSKILPFPCFGFTIRPSSAPKMKPLLEWCQTVKANYLFPREMIEHFVKIKEVETQITVETLKTNVPDDAEMNDIVSFEELYLVKDKSCRAFTPIKSRSLSVPLGSDNYIFVGSSLPSSVPQQYTIMDRENDRFSKTNFGFKKKENHPGKFADRNKSKSKPFVQPKKSKGHFIDLKVNKTLGNRNKLRKENKQKGKKKMWIVY